MAKNQHKPQPTIAQLALQIQALAGRVHAIEVMIEQLGGQPRPAPAGPHYEVPVYQNGRWHRRDGTAYGKPPYYADYPSGDLRSPHVSGDRHQRGRPLPR